MLNKLRPGSIRHKKNYKALQASLQKDGTQVVSVDVFDTLLLRDTKPEIQRFKDIAGLWKEIAGNEFSGSADHLFDLRVVVSKLAYRHVAKVEHCREANHADIINSVLRGSGLPETLFNAFQTAELEYEIQALEPNDDLIAILRRCQESGIRVIAISDMYLSAKDIEALINAHVPEGLIQHVYSSAEFGYGKSSGKLYEAVRHEENIEDFSGWVHCGDNFHSDVFMGRALGLDAVYLPRSLAWRGIAKVRNKVSFSRLGVSQL